MNPRCASVIGLLIGLSTSALFLWGLWVVVNLWHGVRVWPLPK